MASEYDMNVCWLFDDKIKQDNKSFYHMLLPLRPVRKGNELMGRGRSCKEEPCKKAQ